MLFQLYRKCRSRLLCSAFTGTLAMNAVVILHQYALRDCGDGDSIRVIGNTWYNIGGLWLTKKRWIFLGDWSSGNKPPCYCAVLAYERGTEHDEPVHPRLLVSPLLFARKSASKYSCFIAHVLLWCMRCDAYGLSCLLLTAHVLTHMCWQFIFALDLISAGLPPPPLVVIPNPTKHVYSP